MDGNWRPGAEGSNQHGAMNFLLVAMVVLIWFLMEHHGGVLVHAP
jgi:hypothetical protein